MKKLKILLIALVISSCVATKPSTTPGPPRYEAPKYEASIKPVKDKINRKSDIYLDFFIGMAIIFFANLIKDWVL